MEVDKLRKRKGFFKTLVTILLGTRKESFPAKFVIGGRMTITTGLPPFNCHLIQRKRSLQWLAMLQRRHHNNY